MSVSGQGTSNNNLLFVGFNQDDGCFACGTEKGFIIYNCEPLKERFRRDLNGGIGIVEILFRCNILALVGGGRNPKYPPNKVMIWDDYQNKCIAELEFKSPVKAVRLRKDRIVVALETKVYIYNFTDLRLMTSFETTNNPTGLLALSPKESNTVLVCPGLEPGKARIENFDQNKTHNITAHETGLACIALNMEGTLLATASEKGTLIRIYDTNTGEMLRELRRGSATANIYSIKFSPGSKFLLVTSDKGTIHLFAAQESETHSNARSLFSSVGSFLPWVGSEWSFAQFQLPTVRNICAFGPNNSIFAICMDGTFFKIAYDSRNKGECVMKIENSTHLKSTDEQFQG